MCSPRSWTVSSRFCPAVEKMRRPDMRLAGMAVAIGWALFSASVARANPSDLDGFTPGVLSMASSHTAFADDFTAVYYNPAALTAAKDTNFGIGFVLSRPSLSLHFEKEMRAIAERSPPKADGITFGALF